MSDPILSRLARDAIQVQDACNLRGVLRSFHEASLELGRHPDCTGTDWVNHHSIMVLYADKVITLTQAGFGGGEAFSQAYGECTKLAEGN